jgi:hypothetical protein
MIHFFSIFKSYLGLFRTRSVFVLPSLIISTLVIPSLFWRNYLDLIGYFEPHEFVIPFSIFLSILLKTRYYRFYEDKISKLFFGKIRIPVLPNILLTGTTLIYFFLFLFILRPSTPSMTAPYISFFKVTLISLFFNNYITTILFSPTSIFFEAHIFFQMFFALIVFTGRKLLVFCGESLLRYLSLKFLTGNYFIRFGMNHLFNLYRDGSIVTYGVKEIRSTFKSILPNANQIFGIQLAVKILVCRFRVKYLDNPGLSTFVIKFILFFLAPCVFEFRIFEGLYFFKSSQPLPVEIPNSFLGDSNTHFIQDKEISLILTNAFNPRISPTYSGTSRTGILFGSQNGFNFTIFQFFSISSPFLRAL